MRRSKWEGIAARATGKTLRAGDTLRDRRAAAMRKSFRATSRGPAWLLTLAAWAVGTSFACGQSPVPAAARAPSPAIASDRSRRPGDMLRATGRCGGSGSRPRRRGLAGYGPRRSRYPRRPRCRPGRGARPRVRRSGSGRRAAAAAPPARQHHADPRPDGRADRPGQRVAAGRQHATSTSRSPASRSTGRWPCWARRGRSGCRRCSTGRPGIAPTARSRRSTARSRRSTATRCSSAGRRPWPTRSRAPRRGPAIPR